MADSPVILNARVAGRRQVTGVERWTQEVISRLLSLRPDRYRMLAPPRGLSGRFGQPWEQLLLPARAAQQRANVIFSPANLAPLLWPRNVVVIHDAAVLRFPDAYTRLYHQWHRHSNGLGARRALHVFTVSEFARGELIEMLDLAPERVSVCGAGVDERFRPGVSPPPVTARYGLDRPYVLTVGMASRRKNLRALATATAELGRLGVELVWAGPELRHLRDAAAVPGLRALGYVADADLPGLYAGARGFVLPSLYEGFGLPCLEAMACGTPVVAARTSALPEICGDAALLVDPQDPRALADAIVRVATDEETRASLREKGLRRASAYSWDTTTAKLDAVLMTL